MTVRVGSSDGTAVFLREGGPRPSWEFYFLGIAEAVAARADCSRRQVGAVIVKNNRVVATGYNGSPAGGPSCLAGECPRGRLSYAEQPANGSYANCHANHAEANAILWSARADREGASIFITCQPCDQCCRLIAGSGLANVLYPVTDVAGDMIQQVRVTPTLGGLL